jgi:outer membrane protein X
MKRIFFAMLLSSLFFDLEHAQAQSIDGAIRVGGHMGYGTSIETFGIGLRGDYAVTTSILIAPDFMYFFGKNDFVDVNWFDINLNGHYLIEINNPDLVPYALGGLNIAITSLDCNNLPGSICEESSDTDIGLNIGGGMDYSVGRMTMFGELRLVVGQADQLVFIAGVKFPLN